MPGERGSLEKVFGTGSNLELQLQRAFVLAQLGATFPELVLLQLKRHLCICLEGLRVQSLG